MSTKAGLMQGILPN